MHQAFGGLCPVGYPQYKTWTYYSNTTAEPPRQSEAGAQDRCGEAKKPRFVLPREKKAERLSYCCLLPPDQSVEMIKPFPAVNSDMTIGNKHKL